MPTENKYARLSGSTLKIIAMISMFIDHTAACLIYPVFYNSDYNWYPCYIVMRQIGRIAFPIFCFLLVEGFYHTSSRKKYALRLFLFALLSEVPFDLAVFQTFWYPAYQNVFFTLLFGFLTIWAIEKTKEQHASWLLQISVMAAGCILAWLIKTDYDYKGIILILIFYIFYQQTRPRTLTGCLSLAWEPAAILAFVPINLYNGRRGLRIKWMFYLFYPAHLLLLSILRLHFRPF